MIEEDNKTLWCGNLAEQVSEELLYELFLQAGPLEKVRIPKDRDGRQKNFAFITFCHDVSVPYSMNLFRGTSLFQRTLSLQCRARMAQLPPPIRCNTLDPSYDFLSQTNVKQQFAEMTNNIREEDQRYVQAVRQSNSTDLVMASLQGNWSHRHHPYSKSNRDDRRNTRRHGRDREENDQHGEGQRDTKRDWRDRRHNNSNRSNNRSNNYNRREWDEY